MIVTFWICGCPWKGRQIALTERGMCTYSVSRTGRIARNERLLDFPIPALQIRTFSVAFSIVLSRQLTHSIVRNTGCGTRPLDQCSMTCGFLRTPVLLRCSLPVGFHRPYQAGASGIPRPEYSVQGPRLVACMRSRYIDMVGVDSHCRKKGALICI